MTKPKIPILQQVVGIGDPDCKNWYGNLAVPAKRPDEPIKKEVTTK